MRVPLPEQCTSRCWIRLRSRFRTGAGSGEILREQQRVSPDPDQPGERLVDRGHETSIGPLGHEDVMGSRVDALGDPERTPPFDRTPRLRLDVGHGRDRPGHELLVGGPPVRGEPHLRPRGAQIAVRPGEALPRAHHDHDVVRSQTLQERPFVVGEKLRGDEGEVQAQRDPRRGGALLDLGGRGQHRVERPGGHRAQRRPAGEIAPREREPEPTSDRRGELDVEPRQAASRRGGERPALPACRDRQVAGRSHGKRLLRILPTHRVPSHALGPEHVDMRRPGIELPVVVEPVRVRQALVSVGRRQGGGDRSAIPGARTERREQHPARVPSLGAEHARGRAEP